MQRRTITLPQSAAAAPAGPQHNKRKELIANMQQQIQKLRSLLQQPKHTISDFTMRFSSTLTSSAAHQ